MYLEKRKVKGKMKYFLSHSFREGEKVHKIRKYLGEELKQKILEERQKKAEVLILEEISKYKIIRDPLHSKLSEEEIGFVRKLQLKIEVKVSHLSEKQWAAFSEIFTYNTNAIEGSELNTQDVREIIEEDKWPDKSKADIAEAYGVSEALGFIRKAKENFSLDFIKKIHEIVFKNSKPFAGQFRKNGEEVVVRNQLGEILHEGAPQTRVVSLLNELIDWYEKYKKEYPALILAVVVHNQFENIHPFVDGNGRIGRLLLNYILIQGKLPPVNINLKNRKEYYEALRAYDKEHNIRPMIELILKEYKDLKKILAR
jgi:Fic family protein